MKDEEMRDGGRKGEREGGIEKRREEGGSRLPLILSLFTFLTTSSAV